MRRLRIKTNGQRANCLPTKGDLGTRTRLIARFGTFRRPSLLNLLLRFSYTLFAIWQFGAGRFSTKLAPAEGASENAEMEAKTECHGLSDRLLALLAIPYLGRL